MIKKDDHQSSSKPTAELNDVVKRARIACSLCGFEKTSNDDNDDTFDKFGCGGCAAQLPKFGLMKIYPPFAKPIGVIRFKRVLEDTIVSSQQSRFFQSKIIFTHELRKKGESSQHLFENGPTFAQTNKPINDNIHESFTCRLRGEIQDETKDYLVEDHNESSPGAYFGTPVNLMILEKDYNCRWIPYDNPLCCTNNDAGELTTRD
ncbi:hypothetical protein FRACYDRAFT_252143 [Fragilariopsis cylindrus CCMP1102]|uniref:Uncharacterized protein n=1 Tax=Fragilariopsis cylindrus CCMP1102 TaxID=635003 RepID=A0A1E7EMC1_9STRA|nr:hypothetical protein FRACYDRAFT_252143 [Fragilariopsis cylindrus CCMP1102]|eukprot:OEU07041.1 hypothetical protein FRACYDRAFT_252143 [Fragilariopsis cylindrus CCMP1102]